jgi:Photoprotection regulator fluorescence recovery protein
MEGAAVARFLSATQFGNKMSRERKPTMATLPNSNSEDDFSYLRGPKWSGTEKAIARKAFEKALAQEFEMVIQQTKAKARRIEQAADLWELERYLTESRKDIDRRYDYRYSKLTGVFGDLIRRGRISEEDLRGIGEDKLKDVRCYLSR